MFILRGTRTARIKTYVDHDHPCGECRNFDLTVKVFKEYYHFFFIPVAATGVKSVKIRCNACGQPFRSDSLNKQYELRTRVPLYLYSWTILVALAILGGVGMAGFLSIQRKRFVSNPKVGDVYLIHEDSSTLDTYSFLCVARVNGDSVLVYHNNLRYLWAPSQLDSTDHFNADEESRFTRYQLKGMLDRGTIQSVERN